jgi:hypothetical protein
MSHQPQAKLPAIVAFMSFNQVLDARGHIAELQIAAASQFLSDIFRHVL